MGIETGELTLLKAAAMMTKCFPVRWALTNNKHWDQG
jgi:hypothetical protein